MPKNKELVEFLPIAIETSIDYVRHQRNGEYTACFQICGQILLKDGSMLKIKNEILYVTEPSKTLPQREFYSSGLLDPEGKFYHLPQYYHERGALTFFHKPIAQLFREGWLEISHFRVCNYFDPHHDRLSQPQIDYLFDLAQRLGKKITDLFEMHDADLELFKEKFGIEQ